MVLVAELLLWLGSVVRSQTAHGGVADFLARFGKSRDLCRQTDFERWPILSQTKVRVNPV